MAVVEGQGGYETILLERDGTVAILTFNRPEKLNALSPTTMRELGHALGAIQGDEVVGASGEGSGG